MLKEKCENLGVHLECRFRDRNDQREVGELSDRLVQYLKSNQSLREKESKLLFNNLRADQLLTNIGSHHRSLGTSSLARGDILIIIKDIDEFDALFICSACNKPAKKDYSLRDSKLKQCKCGNLRI